MLEALLNGLLYTALALLAGLIVIRLVPKERGLNTAVHPLFLIIVSISIPFLFLGYLLSLGATYAQFFSVSYVDGVITAAGDHVLGTSFFILVVLTVVLLLTFVFLEKRAPLLMSIIHLALFLGMIYAVSLSSHSASLSGMNGVVSNAIHLFAMAFWVGPLFIVSLFGHRLSNQKRFHQWFSALAVFCLLLVSTSGFVMMGEVVPEYVNSWMLSYGQLLLIKHILIVPLLIFGFRHLLSLSGKGAALSTAERQKSFRTESFFVLLVFSATAWLTETEPPHNVLRTLQTEPLSPVMSLFLREPLMENQLIAFSSSIASVLLIIGSIILLLLSLFLAWWVKKTWATAVSAAAFVLLFYFGLMAGVTPGTIPVNLTVHETIEQAIAVEREDEDLDLLTTWELDENSLAVIYAVSEQHLVAERLMIEEDGYRKYLDAEVEIENGFLTGGEQFMDTFMFMENDWVDEELVNTYVTLGFVTDDVDSVQVLFSDEDMTVPVENNVFFHIKSVNQMYDEAHQYRLLDQDEQLIREIEKRQFVHEGHVH